MQSNKIFITAAAALVLLTPLAVDAKKAATKTFPITAQNGSGETGTFTLTADGTDKTTVTVSLTGAPAAAQPAHIHMGTCANLNPAPKYPLTNVLNGKSTTTVDVSLASLTSGTFAVNVHKSVDDIKDYVACGDIASSGMMKAGPMASPSPM